MPTAQEITELPITEAADQATLFLEENIDAIDVVSINPNQRVRPSGDVYPVMDIGFTIPPDRNVYFCHPDAHRNWPKLALHSISLKANQVLSIYQGLRDRADIIPLIDPLPSDYPEPPPPPPPEPV